MLSLERKMKLIWLALDQTSTFHSDSKHAMAHQAREVDSESWITIAGPLKQIIST